jgi:hypothetical protein
VAWDKNETTSGRASSITYNEAKKEFVSMNWNGQTGLLQVLDKDSFALKYAVHDTTATKLPWVNDFVYDTVQHKIIGDFCSGWRQSLYLQYIYTNSSGIYRDGNAITNDYWPSFGMGYYPNMTVFDSINRKYWVLVGDFNQGDYRKLSVGDLNSVPGVFTTYGLPSESFVIQALVFNKVDGKLYGIACEKRYTNPKIVVWNAATSKFEDAPGLSSMGAQYMYGPSIVDERGYIMLFVRKTASLEDAYNENAVRNYELWELSPANSAQRMVASYTDQSQILLRGAYAA